MGKLLMTASDDKQPDETESEKPPDEPPSDSPPDEAHEDEQDASVSTIKSKLKTIGVAFALGTTGYSASIFWTIPFREVTRLPGLTPTASSQLMMNYIALVLGAITIGLVYFRVSGKGIDYIDIHIPNKRQFAIIIGGTLALLIAFFAIGAGTSFFEGVESSEHSMQQTVSDGNIDPQFILLMIPMSFLVIGPSEEFIFRNLVQKRLYDDFTKKTAILIASIIFAIVHFPTYATGSLGAILVSLGSVFVFSVILGGAYALSGNLLIPAVMHGTYNATIFANWYTALAFGFTFL
jgi:membrane protease YdiL (CAAX protease family)